MASPSPNGPARGDRPLMTVDMDGVLASPPLGLPNLAVSRRLRADPLPEQVVQQTGPGNRLASWLMLWRYGGRKLLPGVREGLEALAQKRRLALLTGRSWRGREVIEEWLERYELTPFFEAVYPNNTHLKGAQFKLWMGRQLGAQEHIDDDGAVVFYLASHGVRRVFLRDWALNRGLPYPPQVIVVRSLAEAAERLD